MTNLYEQLKAAIADYENYCNHVQNNDTGVSIINAELYINIKLAKIDEIKAEIAYWENKPGRQYHLIDKSF